MKTNKEIQNEIESTLNAFDLTKQVNVTPFFKDKVMNRLFLEKEERQRRLSWFTPQFQLGMLAVLIILNVFAITQFKNDTAIDTELDEFAQTYDLHQNDEVSLIN